ncbi:DUF262 domain-containing protein, partial [Massilia pinisoli]|uniref:GmrSD restriction endonuclease domain-containing protein n=1 Tax=Massilia pinisoli TaxID=1772194 RepID=UPI0036304831
IPPVFVANTDQEGTLEIIDGSQRIRTVARFLANEFSLKGLEKLTSLNGFFYDDFDHSRKNKFSLIDLRLHVLTDKATPIIRADIFARINTTSQPLTDSQERKGKFANNEFYKFVIEMANEPRFKDEFYTGEKGITGEHEELVLRYFVYADSYQKHNHDVKGFLDNYIEEKGESGFTDAEKSEKEHNFKL